MHLENIASTMVGPSFRKR